MQAFLAPIPAEGQAYPGHANHRIIERSCKDANMMTTRLARFWYGKPMTMIGAYTNTGNVGWTRGKTEIADRRMIRIRCELNLESSTRVPNIMFVKSVKVPIESLMVGIMDGGTGVEGYS